MKKKINVRFNRISLLFLTSIFIFITYFVFPAQNTQKSDIIQRIINTQNSEAGKKGIYVDGIGELWFTTNTDGEFIISGKRLPLKFTGTIDSPTNFSLKASLSESELETITGIFSGLFIFPKVDIELMPTGLKIKSNLTFSKLLSGVSSLLRNHFSLRAFNLTSDILVSDRITLTCNFPEKHTIISDASLGTKLSAEKIRLKISIDLKTKKILSSDMSAELELKLGSQDPSFIKLDSRILLDVAKNNVTISASSTGEIKSVFGISNAKIQKINFKYNGSNKLFEFDFNMSDFNFSSLPFFDNSIKKLLKKTTIAHASFKYANKNGMIFDENIKAGLTVKLAANIYDTNTNIFFKYEPQGKAFYLETSLKNFSLKKLGIIPVNMQKYLPEFTVETLTVKYANKEQTIDNVKVKHGFTINGKVNIGSSTTDIKITQETDTQFTLVEIDVNSVNLEQFVPQNLIPSHMKDLFSKISISRASLKYANKSAVHDGKKVYQGIHIEGNMRYAENTGSLVFIYSDTDKILSLNTKLSKIALSKISVFPSSVNNIITGIQIQNASLDYVNKTGTLEGNPVKAGLNITGDLILGGVTTKFDVVYDKDKNFFAIKSTINRIGLSDVSLPGFKLSIPENIKNYLKKFQASSVTITYANNKGMFHDVELKKGFTASGNITIPGSEGKFKLINLPEEKLFYVYTFINRINPVSLGIIPNELSATASKYSLTNAQIVYSSKKTSIDGTDVDKGLRLSADAQMNRIQTKFLFFYNKEADFFYLKTIFPSTTLYDINKSVLPVELPEIINNFAKNVGTNDVIFEYANKSGNVDGKAVEAGVRTSGKMHVYSANGGFKFIYDKKEKFYYLNINMTKINLGSLPLLPGEVKNIASKITFNNLSLVYANKNGKVDGKTVYVGFDFSGDAKLGNIESHYSIQYDTEKKAFVINTHITRATLQDINVFSDAAWMPSEVNELTKKCAVENADISYSNYSGKFRGNTIVKGLKVTGTLEIFSKKATFEVDYQANEKFYYFNTTVDAVSLYDVNVFRAVSSLPSQMRNFGKNIIMARSTFSYANKAGLVGTKKISEGLSINGKFQIGSKTGTIDFRYSSQKQLYGLELTLDKITLSDIDIISWFVTMPSNIKKFTDKISLDNIQLKYANKNGEIGENKYNQGLSISAVANAFNKKGKLAFLNSPSANAYYFELELGRISLDDINIFKDFMTIPTEITKIGKAIALKNFVFGYANNPGKIGTKIFKKGINVSGTPDLSGIPGVKVLLNSLHLNDLKLNFMPDTGIGFDANIKFHGKLYNFLVKFLKLKLPDLKLHIGIKGSSLDFSITLMKFGNAVANINPALGTQIKLETVTLKINVPLQGGMPAFEFVMAMQVKPSKWDKWLHFVPAIKFDPVAQSIGFAATMKDTWEHPFGIKAGNILIQNVAFEIMINLETGLPTKLGFIGERLRFFNRNFGFMFLIAASQPSVSLGFKADKLYITDIPTLAFLPASFLKNTVYLKNVDVQISPTGGSVGELQIKPGITVKGEAKLGPLNGWIDLSTGSLTSFKGYFKGKINTGINEIEHAILEKVKKVPYLKPLLKKILEAFAVNSISFDFNASTTKVQAKMAVSIKLFGKNHNLKLDVEFNPLKLATVVVKEIQHLLKDELAKLWKAMKKEVLALANTVKKDTVKLYNSVKSWMSNNVGPFVSAVSDYVKKIAYTAYKTVKQFFEVKTKDWWKPWKWHWETIVKFVKEAYTAFKYEVHSFSYEQRLNKLKEYAANIIKQSTKTSIDSANGYFTRITAKINDFDGNELKKIVDDTFQPILDDACGHWMTVYNDNEVGHFFSSSTDTANGLKEYRALITAGFQQVKIKIIEAFKKAFTNKDVVLKLINEKSNKIWFNKFAVSR